MIPHFIYVFSEISREALSSAGYRMLGSPCEGVWIFAEDPEKEFPHDLFERRDYCISNRLTFAGGTVGSTSDTGG